jgi:hypothetical protein
MKTGEKMRKNLKDVIAAKTTKIKETAERMITKDLDKIS